MKHLMMITVAVLLLAGCATGYQKDTGAMTTGGYSDKRLQADLFEISFDGLVSREVAVRYFYRRAAEVTVQNGFRYFVLVTPESRDYAGKGTYLYGRSPKLYEKGSSMGVTRRNVFSMIQCHKERPSIPYGEVFDAEAILKSAP